MLHARTIKKKVCGISSERYQRRMRSKGRKVNVLQSPPLPRCNTTAQESSRTDEERCAYIHVKLSMYPSS